MGTVYREQYTAPLPKGAEVVTLKGEQVARWKPTKGRAKTAPITTGKDGSLRIVVRSATYSAKYRDGQGIVRKISTGCRDESAARCVLNELERRAELVRSGVISAAEDRVANHQRSPLETHRNDWLTSIRASGRSARHIENAERLTLRVCDECGFNTLRDIESSRFESWLATKLDEGMSARTRNSYLQALSALCEWCVRNGRLTFNPLKTVSKADEKSDRRRQRRAMTEDELHRLLHVARWRPLAEFGRETERKDAAEVSGKRDTWKAAPLTYDTLDVAVERARERLAQRPDFVEQLDDRGRERQLLYKVMLSTGLRKGELASVCLRNLDLEGERPSLTLEAKNEKNRQGNTIPLRTDLAAELREWLCNRATKRRLEAQNAPTIKFDRKAKFNIEAARRANERDGLKPDEFLFDVPTGLVRILDRDLQAAGIAKRDDRGRTLDVHALRHTFGTHLSKAGVSLRTAQAAMRHSTPTLTANVYTDPRLLDIHGAVEALPTLSLTATRKDVPEVMRATGTMGCYTNPEGNLGPNLGPTSGKPCLSMAFIGTEPEHFVQASSKTSDAEEVLNSSEKASSEDVSDEAFEGVANRIRTGDIQNHNLAL